MVLSWLRTGKGRREVTPQRRLPRLLRPALPRLEWLEARTLPATSITILPGAAGTGSQDATFIGHGGQLLFADPDVGANTLSTGALASIASTADILVQATSSITFNDLGGTFTLQTGLGNSSTFTTATSGGGAIAFLNQANTLATSGGSILLSAGKNLTAANFNSAGGDVSLVAGADSAGDLSARGILTAGSGNITMQATNAGGGIISQSGTASGLGINVSATGNVTLDALRGTTVAIVSNTGSINSAGASAIQASTHLSLAAATGITVNTLAADMEASNSTSGDISVTQLASPAQPQTINGTGVVNSAAGGSISIDNLGSSVTVASGVAVHSNNGSISLTGLDLNLAGTVNSGTARTTLGNSTAGRAIDVGTNTPGEIGLTQAELNNVTAAVLQIGTATAGPINISAAITNPAGWTTLTLLNGGTITEAAAGSLTLPNLRVASFGPVNLNNANDVDALAASSAAWFAFNNGTNTLTVGVVDGATGISTTDSDIILTADNLDLAQSVNAGAGTVTLEPFTNSLPITLGTASVPGTTFGVTDSELGQVTAGILRIGQTAHFGGISITSAITRRAGFDTLSLITDAGISQTAPVSVANLAVQYAGDVVLTNSGNDADTFAADAISFAAGNLSYTDVNDLTIGSIDGVNGAGTAVGDVNLVTGGALTINQLLGAGGGGTLTIDAGGSVTEGVNGEARGSQMLLLGAGPYVLDNPGNLTSNLAALVSGSITYIQNSSTFVLTIDTVGGVNGVTGGGDVNITNQADDLVVSQQVSGPQVSLTAGGLDHILTNNSTITASSAVSLTADRMAIDGGLILTDKGGSNVVTLRGSSSGRTVDLGGITDPNGTLTISQGELNTITTDIVRVGDLSTGGSITITAPLSDATTGFGVLSLVTEIGAGISQNSGATLTFTGLQAAGNAGVSLGENNVVDTLAGATQSGAFTFNDSTNLTVGEVDGGLGFGFGIGIITQGQQINLTVNVLNDSLVINQGLDATHSFGSPVPGGADITLTADNMALNNNSPSSAINAGTSGILTLQPFTTSNTIAVGGADAAGTLGIDDNDLANTSASAIRIGSGAQTGTVTVAGTIAAHAGYNTLDLIATGSGGAITQTTGSIAVANLALQADAGIGSASAIQIVGPINLAFVNASSGDVQISATGAVTVAAVDGVGTSANNASGGTETLSADSPFTFSVNDTSSGTITVTTTETASETGTPLPPPDDDITVETGVTVESTGGDIVFTSGDSIVIQTGGTVTSDTGSVSLTAGVGDNDNDGTLELNGTVNSSTGLTLTSSGDICVGTINAPGQLVTITSTNGAILDCDTGETEPTNPTDDFTSGASVDITAGSLALSASTGIGIVSGDGVGPLEIQVASLEAQTATGGIFITNGVAEPVTLTIGGVSAALAGVQVTGSGDIQLVNQGTIDIVTGGEVVRGPNNITVIATGDVNTGNQTAISAIFSTTAGDVSVTGGGSLNLGTAGSIGDVGANNGNVSLTATAGDITLDNNTSVFANGSGKTITATAGGNISLRATTVAGANIDSNGGAISLQTGSGGVFTLDSGSGGHIGSGPFYAAANGGAITVSADDMVINDPISAAGTTTSGVVTLQQAGTTTRDIDLGLGTTAGDLGLSDAELGQVTASVLRIGRTDNAGALNITAAITAHAGFDTLSLRSGGAITEAALFDSVTVANLALQAAGDALLNNPGDVGTLAAKVGGFLIYADSNDLTVGSVDGVDGIDANGLVDMSVPGTLTITDTPAAIDVNTNAHDFTAFNMVDFVNSAGAIVSTGGGLLEIFADSMSLGLTSQLDAGSGRAELAPESSGRGIHLGDTGSPTVLGLTADELNTVTAGILQIGNGSAGDMTIAAAIAPSGASTLDLETGGAVIDGNTSEPDVTVANLVLRTAAGVSLDTAVSALAFANTGGAVTINNSGALVISSLDGLTTSSNTGTTTSITTASPLEIGVDTTSAGTLTLIASTDVTIDTGVTVRSTAGDVVLNAGGNLSLPSGATLHADTGAISILFGQAGTGGTLTLDGDLIGASASAAGGSGNDIFNVNPTSTPDISLIGDLGDDTFNLTPNASATLTVHGDDPTPPAVPGDLLNVNLAGTTTPTLSASFGPTGYSGSWTFGNRQAVNFDGIERLLQQARIAAGSGHGAQPLVNVFDTAGNLLASFLAFDPSFTGGVRVAVGDVNGDGVPDVIAAKGSGDTPEVIVVDGTKLDQLQPNGQIDPSALLADFLAYSPLFPGGVYIAFGISTDGLPVIVTGPGSGGGPHVKVINATLLGDLLPDGEIDRSALLGQFYAYSPLFPGGVRVAVGDMNGDGVLDIITGAGPGGGPHVEIVDGSKLGSIHGEAQPADLLATFYAFSIDFTGGVFVTVGAGLSGPELIASQGLKGTSLVNVYDAAVLQSSGKTAALLATFSAFDPTLGAAVRLAAADLNGDGVLDVYMSPGPGSALMVKVVDGTKLDQKQPDGEIDDSALLDDFFAFNPLFSQGVFVGGN